MNNAIASQTNEHPRPALAFRIGVPIGATTLAEVGIYLGATIYIASHSVGAVAAHTLVMRLAGVAYALPLAHSQVATIRVAQVSECVSRRIVVLTQLQLACCSALLLCASLLLLAEPAAGLLNDGSVLGQRSAQTAFVLILILAVTELVEPFTATASGILRGRQDTLVPMIISMACYWLFSVPLALWVTPRFFSVAESVWLALLAGMCLSAGLLAERLYRFFWRRHWQADA